MHTTRIAGISVLGRPHDTHGASQPTLVPMQTDTGGEFLSPSGNISCEVDYHRVGLTQTYCQTATPPRSVTMGVAGSTKPAQASYASRTRAKARAKDLAAPRPHAAAPRYSGW